MRKANLTDAKVRAAKPREAAFKLSDGGGLFLHVMPTGSKLWRFRFWLDGKEGLFALGSYPEIGLADARTAADAARALVKQGINPADAKREERRRNVEEAEAKRRASENSFEKVAREWLDAGRAEWAPGTHRAKKARVERHLLPALGALPMGKIGAREIRPILAACEKGGAWAATHTKGDLSGIFTFAMVRGLCDSNPVPGLRGLVKVPKSQGKAVLSPAQIRAFFEGLEAYRGYPETAVCLRLIALTACRPGEAADAEWSEIDFEAKVWRRPAEKMKARRDHVSPLSSQAVALLEGLRAITGRGRYLFPSRDGKTFATRERLGYAMRDLNLGERASPHCWRTTFSTWANERGFRPDAIERQLAHVEGNKVRATYNRALLLEERREIMQAWASYLDAAQADNVVPLRRAGA